MAVTTGMYTGANRSAQDALTNRIGELNTKMKETADAMAKATPEEAAKLRSEMEQLSFLLEQTNKALEKLYAADEKSKGTN